MSQLNISLLTTGDIIESIFLGRWCSHQSPTIGTSIPQPINPCWMIFSMKETIQKWGYPGVSLRPVALRLEMVPTTGPMPEPDDEWPKTHQNPWRTDQNHKNPWIIHVYNGKTWNSMAYAMVCLVNQFSRENPRNPMVVLIYIRWPTCSSCLGW